MSATRVVADIAWSYPTPIPERADIAELICFFDERVDRITVDGVAVARPETPWSAPAAVVARGGARRARPEWRAR